MADKPATTPLTYRQAGVDAEGADLLVDRIGALARSTYRRGLVAGVGGFASLFSLADARAGRPPMKDPLLVAGTDGVGTKLQLAFLTGRHDTVGIDLVAMCVNDVLTCGAEPLFFLDYYGTGKLDGAVLEAVVSGVAEGCRRARCALTGGETAELPGMYAPGEYDLAGFALGVVDREQVIDGRDVTPGDVVIGVRSRGLHSNGYSLARKALFERLGLGVTSAVPGLGRSLGDELLEPTAIYTTLLDALFGVARPKALAHITGGGIPGNLPRVLPPGTIARVDTGAWVPHPIFSVIASAGVERAEMFKTFNMGVGLCVVVSSAATEQALAAITSAGETATVIGEITAGGPGREAAVELI